MDNTQGGLDTHQRVRHCLEPATNRLCLPAERGAEADPFDHACDRAPLLRLQPVMHGLFDEVVLFEPGAGASVEARDRLGGDTAAETIPQDIPEQVMVAIPASLVVQQNDKKIGPLKPFQDTLAVRIDGDALTRLSRGG